MSSFYEDASLVVIPSGYKTSKIYAEKPTDGSGDLTFTRASGATRVASNGLIEKVRTNLILQSQDFSTTWSANSCTVATNTTANPLNGAVNADTITFTGGTTQKYVIQAFSFNGNYTVSAYLKAGTNQFVQFLLGSDAGLYANFDLVNGTASATGSTATIVAAGNGWFRCSMSFTSTTGTHVFILAVDSLAATRFSTTSSTGTLIAFGYQLETGDIATDYIPTTTAAVSVGPVSNVPRLDYLGSSCPRLLLEPQRTNSAQYSEQADNAYWLKFQATITANQAISPDGTLNADRLTTSGAESVIYRTGQTAGSLSFFVKAQTLSAGARFIISVDGVGNATWNQDGTLFSVTGGTATNAVNFGNGWYRCNFNVTSGSIINFGLTNAASGNTAFIWGFQNEASATYATSYIPTLGASVTRVADAASKTGISSLIGQTEGVLFVDYNYEAKPDSSGNIPIVVYTGSSEAYIYITNAGALRFELYNAGSLQALISGTIGAAGRKKIAFAYKQNDFVAYMNGVQIGTDTSGTVGAMASVSIGCYYTSDYSSVSGINQALLFKTRLTNAQLAELTTL